MSGNSRKAQFASLLAGLTQVILLFVLFASFAHGQANEGAIAGNVLDPSGATVPDVAITAREVNTGSTYTTASSTAGAYKFPNVRPGRYEINATHDGFKTAHLAGVIVEVGTTSSLDIKMVTGTVAETVVVEADAPTVQSETSEIGTTFTSKQVDELPLPLGSAVQYMRSPEAFVFLAPGTVGPGSGSGSGGTFESKITGGQNYATEVLLDGASTFRSENGSSFDETAPSVDALGEYKLLTSTVPAEYDRTTGGIEIFSTKSGTNAFHGIAYDIFRNEDLDANSWINNYNDLPRQLDRQNDYGGTFGGPVWIPHVYNGKDKSFFFFSWEQFRENNGGTTVSTVPTTAERGGDFNSTLNTANVLGTNPCDGTPIYAGEIFDPTTTRTVGSGASATTCRTAFMNEPGSTGNVIPSSEIASVANNILSFFPTPTNGNQFNNYVYPYAFPTLATTMTVRIDQNVGAKDKAYFTYSSRTNNRLSTNPEWATAAGDGRNQTFTTHFIRFGDDYTIGSTMLNHFSIGYNRTNSANIGAGVRYGNGADWDDKLGITGLSGPMFPGIGLAQGYSSAGDGVDGDTIDNGFRTNDSFSWVKGKHEMKFGADWRYQQYNALNYASTSGNFNFSNGETAGSLGALNTVANTGNVIASLLLGYVDNANASTYSSQPRWLRSYFGFFFEDSFKITPTLTLNYGLRWSMDQPNKEGSDQTSNISLTTPNPGAGGLPGALVFAGVGTGRNGVSGERWANTYHRDFGPRLAFAWSPERLGGKTVVRGGYGILYAPLLYADFGAFMRTGFQANPAFSVGDGFTPAFNLSTGFPSFTAPPNLDPTQLNNQGPQYIDPTYGRPGMVQNWSLEIQHQIATDFIASIAYVGEHGTHLHSQFDAVNSLNPQYFSMGSELTESLTQAGLPAPYAGFPVNAVDGVARSLTPFPQYLGFNTDGALENFGQSTYNALEAQLHRRFRNGLTLIVSYTWSKTLTDADSALPYFATANQGGGQLQDPFDKKDDKAISGQDLPQNLVLSYVYELPVGKGKRFLNRSGVVDRLVGGWSIGGIHHYESGQPIAFCCATGIPFYDGAIRFDLTGQPIFTTAYRSAGFNPLTDPIFNAAAFSDPNSATNVAQYGYRLGTSARVMGNVRMPWYTSEDFNLQKRTHITEATALLIKMEAFDAFNRTIWNRPGDLNPNDAAIGSFALINPGAPLLGPRKVQLTMRFEF
jgi:hypothetical protein